MLCTPAMHRSNAFPGLRRLSLNVHEAALIGNEIVSVGHKLSYTFSICMSTSVDILAVLFEKSPLTGKKPTI